jgi:hypothetical protein
MIKIGLIGDLGSIATHIDQLKSVKEIQLIGKSSVGMMEEPAGKYLSIPEFNRKELIDAADFLIIDKSQLVVPDLIRQAVKNGKHLFFTDCPDISPEHCSDLLKLAGEAKSMIHIGTLPGSESFIHWLRTNWQEPAYINLFESLPELPDKVTYLSRYLLFAFTFFKASPQKIRACGIRQAESGFYFINLRLDFPTYSTFNLELLIQPYSSRNIRVALPGNYLTGDFTTQRMSLNHKETTLPHSPMNPLAKMLNDFYSGDIYAHSNLELYYASLLTLREVLRKVELFTPWRSV